MRALAATTPWLLALALAATGCGAEQRDEEPRIPGDVLTVYSSGPLSGVQGARARAVDAGQQLALAQTGNRVGRWRIAYVGLDDADPRSGRWEPALVAANARRAAQDPSTVAYLGEMDSGASAVAIPILNQRGILAVSPLDGVAGFTGRPGAGPGEPEKYYPTHRRTFGRIAPPDDVQAAALITTLQDQRVSRIFLAHDDSLYGRSLALGVQRRARPSGIAVLANRGIDPRSVDPRRLGADVEASGAGAFVYAGQLQPRVGLIFRLVGMGHPRLELLAASALADSAFTSRLGPVERRTAITAPMLPSRFLGPAAGTFERRFRAVYGAPPDAGAAYGYEAMSLVLDAIRRAGPDANRRATVVSAYLRTRARAGALGRYDVDARGDTSIQTYGLYRVRGGRAVFDRVLDPLGA